MTLEAAVNGDARRIRLQVNEGQVEYAWGEAQGTLDVREVEPSVYAVIAAGRSVTITIGENGWAEANGAVFQVEVTDPRNAVSGRGSQGRSGRVRIAAPMPGRVIRVLVNPGDAVTAGQGLVVVEAMKMQNEMKAPRDAVVAAVKTQNGATVAAGDALVILE
jgi:biotin carboxyl carrier protein